jgi:hypothetical protein
MTAERPHSEVDDVTPKPNRWYVELFRLRTMPEHSTDTDDDKGARRYTCTHYGEVGCKSARRDQRYDRGDD